MRNKTTHWNRSNLQLLFNIGLPAVKKSVIFVYPHYYG